MGVNGVFCAMMLSGLIYAAATGRLDAAQNALLAGGGEAVGLLLNLAGAYAFFGGLLFLYGIAAVIYNKFFSKKSQTN